MLKSPIFFLRIEQVSAPPPETTSHNIAKNCIVPFWHCQKTSSDSSTAHAFVFVYLIYFLCRQTCCVYLPGASMFSFHLGHSLLLIGLLLGWLLPASDAASLFCRTDRVSPRRRLFSPRWRRQKAACSLWHSWLPISWRYLGHTRARYGKVKAGGMLAFGRMAEWVSLFARLVGMGHALVLSIVVPGQLQRMPCWNSSGTLFLHSCVIIDKFIIDPVPFYLCTCFVAVRIWRFAGALLFCYFSLYFVLLKLCWVADWFFIPHAPGWAAATPSSL